MAHRHCTDLPAPMFLQVGIFHCSLFNGDNRARVSLVPVSSTQRLCWYTAHLAMSTSSTQDEPSSPPGRKRACSGALQLGPRKKPYVMLTFKIVDCELIRIHLVGLLRIPWCTMGVILGGQSMPFAMCKHSS